MSVFEIAAKHQSNLNKAEKSGAFLEAGYDYEFKAVLRSAVHESLDRFIWMLNVLHCLESCPDYADGLHKSYIFEFE